MYISDKNNTSKHKMLILSEFVYYEGIKNPKLRGPAWEKND